MADAELGIKVTTQGVQQSAGELDRLKTSTQGVTQSVKDMQSAQKQTASTTSATSQAFGQISSAAKELDNAHKSATASTRAFRDAVHVLDPVLASAGAGMGGFSGFAGAARTGIIGLTAAIAGGFVLALATSADKLTALEQRLKDLSPRGNETFKQVSDAAKKTGEDIGALEQIAETFSIALGRNNVGKFVGDVDRIGMSAGNATKVFADMIKASRANDTAVAQAIDSFREKGLFTLQIFDQLQRASPGVSKMFMDAFHQSDVETFRKELEQTPKTAQQVAVALSGISQSAADAASKVKTVGGSFGEVKSAWDDLSKALKDTGVFSALAGAISSFAQMIRNTARELEGIAYAATTAWAAIRGNGMAGGSGLPIGQPPYGGIPYAPDDLGSLNANYSPRYNGLGNFVPAPGNYNDYSDVSFFPSDTMETFATGGSFTVGGSGITDKTPVSFMATRGEQVTVSPPSAGSSATNASLTNSITSSGSRTVSSITGAKMDIVTAINRMNTSVTGALQMGAAGNQKTSVFIQQGNNNNPYRDTLAGGSGGFRLVSGGDNGPSFNAGGFYDPYAPIGNNDYVDTSGPDAAYYSQYGPSVASIGVANPGGGQGPDNLYEDFYGSYATGGSFMVGGSGQTDRTPVRLMATRGETISVAPPGIPLVRRPIGRTPTINVNVYGVTSPAAFIPAAAQIKRALSRQMR